MSDRHLRLEDQIPRLMRYAAALTRDVEQANELVEDTVSEALRQGRPSQRADLRLWLFGILHELRGNPFRQTDPAAISTDAVANPAAPLTLSDLDRAIEQLPEAQRAVILLIGLEGMSYEETSVILGISVGTMRSRLTRGRDSLRRAMGVVEPRLARAA